MLVLLSIYLRVRWRCLIRIDKALLGRHYRNTPSKLGIQFCLHVTSLFIVDVGYNYPSIIQRIQYTSLMCKTRVLQTWMKKKDRRGFFIFYCSQNWFAICITHWGILLQLPYKNEKGFCKYHISAIRTLFSKTNKYLSCINHYDLLTCQFNIYFNYRMCDKKFL